MAFTDQRSWQANPAAATAVIALHAAAGFALIAGLTVEYVLPPPEVRTKGVNVPLEPPPKPDDPPPSDEKVLDPPSSSQVYTPPSPLPPLGSDNRIETVGELPPLGPIVERPGPGEGRIVPPPTPPPSPPGLEPIGAKPSNSPGNWLRAKDYRPSWIRRELTGTVGFALRIGADGHVDSCSLTGSTGHSELDGATCRLIERRARFEPARNSAGSATAGTYEGRVRWVLPE